MNKKIIIKAKGIYDSCEEKLKTGYGLLLEKEMISEVEKTEELCKKYPDAEVKDWSSMYLFPGLINTHVHLEFDASSEARENFLAESVGTRFLLSSVNAAAMVQSGVTTIRDAGSSWELLNLRKHRAKDLMPQPYIQFAGPPLTVTGGHMRFVEEGCETDSIEDMRKQVRIRQKRSCDAIKLIPTGGQMTPGSLPERTSMSIEEISAVCEEAHNLQLPVFAHCLTTEGFVRCVQSGVDCIEHVACFVRNPENQLLERIYEPERMNIAAGKGVYFMMGLAASYRKLDDFRDGKIPCGPNETFWLKQEEMMFDIFRKCVELGMIPVCGTDTGTTGSYFDETWLELALMVERAGLTPEEAIRVGTVNSAACLGIQTGELKKGYFADVIALSENPLENIRAFSDVKHVVCRGNIVR